MSAQESAISTNENVAKCYRKHTKLFHGAVLTFLTDTAFAHHKYSAISLFHTHCLHFLHLKIRWQRSQTFAFRLFVCTLYKSALSVKFTRPSKATRNKSALSSGQQSGLNLGKPPKETVIKGFRMVLWWWVIVVWQRPGPSIIFEFGVRK